MPLTEIAIRQAKSKEQLFFLPDGRGLMLEVRPTGKKSWVVRYYIKGKERRKVIGEYPDTPLATAREECLRLKKQAKTGKSEVRSVAGRTFGDVYDEWRRVKVLPSLSEGYAEKTDLRIKKHVLPFFENLRIQDIKSPDILQVCRRIEAAGTVNTAHRIRQLIGQIFRYAIAAGITDTAPSGALQGALQNLKTSNYPTITDPKRIAALMRSMKEYPHGVVRFALMYSILTFCRPGEIRQAEWDEINIENAEWRIPAEKMKMRRPHIVPLADQSVQILHELKNLTGHQKWLFPSERHDGRPMSDGTVRVALRFLGYPKEEITAHSFRGMASTILNENGFSPDVIERQLAHVEGNKIRAAYNHAEYMPERKKMMIWWADWLTNLV